MLFYDNYNKVANAEAITNAIHVLQAKAENGDKTFPLSLRVAWNNGDILYDLTNDKWQCVKISQQGWEIIDNTPNPMFIRYNQKPQAYPDRNYEGDIFDRFLKLTNLKEEKDRILLKVYIVTTFIPDIPHAMLILHGEQGSAKSTSQDLIKLTIDPAKPRTLTIYGDVKEFIQQLAHNYVAFYDNLKRTPQWLSDEACKAVTGVGDTKRKHYTDDDDIVYEYRRCLGFNGINNSLTEPDALDRSLMIELQRIRKENRRQDNEIISQFLDLRPKLLGYIFDILVKTLQIKPTVRLNDLPRMADFAIWGEAIARAMGHKPMEFVNAYYDNIGKQNVEAIENHPFGQAVARYMGDNEVLKGSPLEILEQLEVFAQRNGIKTDHKLWPKNSNTVTRRLNQIASTLLEGLALDVQITRVTNVKGKFNTSYIEILKTPPVSPEPPETGIHEGNSYHFTGDTLATGGMISPVSQISPVESTENRAQNDVTGDTGDTGDNCSNEGGGGVVVSEMQPSPSWLFKCYYCEDFNTNNRDYYESHVMLEHFGRPAFPTETEIEKYGLKAQGKEWEV